MPNLKQTQIISFLKFAGLSILNSYSMLFFSKNSWLAVMILVISFFNPHSGLAGVAATAIALLSAYAMGFGRLQVKTGLYTYSALLLGLGMGTFYDYSAAFWILLAFASLISVLLSAAFIAKLAKNGLPALSLGFILSFWLVMLASKEFSAIGLTTRNIYWLNEMYATGGNKLIYYFQLIENWTLPDYVAGFFRSMSAIIFQNNLLAGILLSIGLLIHSRIGFLLMVVGYAVAMIFNGFMGGFPLGGVNYYNMGTNFMLVAVAIGGFYIIPSIFSFLWACLIVPLSYILVVALGKITFLWGLPVFSLPFCIAVILFLYCLKLRTNPGRLVLTPIQYYSPEINLYRYINGKDRLMNQFYHHLALPVLGEWMVSQGYNGSMTHKGDWSKALDFVILDPEMKTYAMPGIMPEHFYCYNKPVVSPADGIVEEVVDFIDDNEIGKTNTGQNWGNSIVIKHADSLYTKLSHLKKNSFKVIKGQYVRKGEMIATCGSSGRSPEPHLHFQVQSTPYVGSKTKYYPLSFFYSRKDDNEKLETFVVPKEGDFVTNVMTNKQLQKAFNFQPGFVLKVSADGFGTEEWEVVTSIYNESYLYCEQHNAFAYFTYNGTLFYFINYFGKKDTLLYLFYLSAYKVLLSAEKDITVNDNYPLNILGFRPIRWIQDLIAPFSIFIKINYQCKVRKESGLSDHHLELNSEQNQSILGIAKEKMRSTIIVQNGALHAFKVIINNKTIEATCTE